MRKVLRAILPALLALLVAPGAAAEADYGTVSLRAERFFKYQEWGSALAMYELMLDMRPMEIPTYYHAIFVSGMLRNENRQMEMIERTQRQGIALDSIFSGVRSVSFAMGEGDEYEKLLKLVRDRQPWLSRGIDIYLLEYYEYRNDADNMILLAEALLNTTPDNIPYVRILAKAYMMAGRIDESLTCYKHILREIPLDYDASLSLGVYYNSRLAESNTADAAADCAALAESYLADAYGVRPTPYVAEMLSKLRARRM